jgi:hypothetical protein
LHDEIFGGETGWQSEPVPELQGAGIDEGAAGVGIGSVKRDRSRPGFGEGGRAAQDRGDRAGLKIVSGAGEDACGGRDVAGLKGNDADGVGESAEFEGAVVDREGARVRQAVVRSE